MLIQTETYPEATGRWPKQGQHILCHQTTDQLVVYQAYNHRIADYAVKQQAFGGNDYSYNRMSWIKPNFLWMMYRCGWASKPNQERVLAIWIDKADFEAILAEAVFSSYQASQYSSHESWRKELEQKEVRLQWDPDHDPYGNKQERRAIQIGMKGDVLKRFGTERIKAIEDVTVFVKEQKIHVDRKELDGLLVPVETIYNSQDETVRARVAVD